MPSQSTRTHRDNAVRCLVLTGAGKAFCVGQDLKEATAGDKPMDFAARLRAGYNPVIEALAQLRVPTVAGINGPVAGAGWSLALACDCRIACRRARFVAAFSNIGLVPDSAMTWTLPRLVGYARALEIAWWSEPISAEAAQGMGLVNRVVDDEAFTSELTKFAESLARRPTKGLVLTRQAMMAGMNNDISAQLEYEAMLQSIAGHTRDYAEGVSAFIEKRQPEFAGE